MEGNNRRGKTRNLFRKTGNIKGTFHPKIGTIKDRKDRDQVKEEEKKRRKEYMKDCTKKILMNKIATVCVSHPEPDVLEGEVKWTLRSTAVH